MNYRRKSIRLRNYDYRSQGLYYLTICTQNIVITNLITNNTESRRGRPMCLPEHTGSPLQKSKPTLGQMVQWFKTITTNYYIQGIKTKNWPSFNKRLWQRNYFEHIIRDEQSLNKIRQYIKNNPKNYKINN